MGALTALGALLERHPELKTDASVAALLGGQVGPSFLPRGGPRRRPRQQHPQHANNTSQLALHPFNALHPMQAPVAEVAYTLEALLVRPSLTLAVAGALRSCGSLLRLISYAVSRRLAAAAPTDDNADFGVALVLVLELAPHCGV
jgi:hypothetical protein